MMLFNKILTFILLNKSILLKTHDHFEQSCTLRQKALRRSQGNSLPT